MPSPATGVLAEILLNTDDEAEPGALLARIEAGTSEPLPFVPSEVEAPRGRVERPSTLLGTNG